MLPSWLPTPEPTPPSSDPDDDPVDVVAEPPARPDGPGPLTTTAPYTLRGAFVWAPPAAPQRAGVADALPVAVQALPPPPLASVDVTHSHPDLMAGPPPTHLPEDPAQPTSSTGGAAPVDVVRRHPASPAAWAALAGAGPGRQADPVTVYAYARVGYHRSLDLLRRNGWKGHGPVPWEHEPNRGFLRCLALLAWPPARSARPRSGSAARRSCATPARRRTTSCSG